MKHWSYLMQIEIMLKHLKDSVKVDGDFIEFGIYKGRSFSFLIKEASRLGRKAYGIDSFEGLAQPSKLDWSENNTLSYPKGKFAVSKQVVESQLKREHSESDFEIIAGFVPEVLSKIPENRYAFAIVDLVHYHPTKQALEYIWEKMSYGGTLYFDNYAPNSTRLCSRAINEFIRAHKDELIVSRQMMINGVKQKELAIKCLRKELKPRNWKKSDLLKRPVTIALVLKNGGGVYNYKYVNNIAEAIKENITIDHRLVCLTDNSVNFSKTAIDKVIPFKHNYPKWWGKVELFQPDLFEGQQVFYFDLDTFVIKNIDDILMYDGEFCALRDFYHLHSMGSGLMSWHGNRITRIYQEFIQKPKRVMDANAAEGDQKWIAALAPSIDYFQDLFPNEIVSYKAHCLIHNNITIPNKAKIICFHGKPRPHELDNTLKRYWKQ
jgi:hypothetical protein